MKNNVNKLIFKMGLIFLTFHAFAEVPVIDLTSIAKLTEQITNLQQQVAYMQQNLTQLGTYNWGDINSAAGQIANVMNSANGLSYASQNIDTQFRQQFPGYQPTTNFGQMYTQNSTTSLNTIKGTLQALNMSYGTFQSDQLRLQAMQGQASGATGAMQALSVNAQLAGETANQVAQLRSVMLAQSSAQSTYMANQINNEAQAKANLSQTIKGGSTQMMTYGSNKINADY